MKKHFNFKSMYRTALVALCLMTVGVGQMWGNTTHPIYCAIKSSSLGSGTLKINVHKGSSKDGGVWFRTTMEKMPTTIHKAATGETKDLYYGMIEYVEEGLQEIQFEIWDGDEKREWHSAFSSWWTSDGYTKPVYDYENKNFTTYPASLSEKTSYVYFNAADWTDAFIQLGVGHGLYQGYNQLSPLTNTTLYYGNPSLNYGDAVHITFIGHYENFGTGNNWLTDLTSHANHYAGFLHYSLVENNFYYFSRNSGDANGTALSYSHLGSESTSYQSLNKTQTVQARVKATGSSYSDAAFASWPGSVSVVRTYMSSASATSTPDAANMSSATTSAVITSSITLTASANSGYYFEGWGDASNSNPTDGTAAKTYTITGDKTSYAFFSQAYTLTYDVKGDYSTSTVTCYSVADYTGAKTSGSSIPTGHLITIVATPATGYEVKGWYSDASCTSAYTSGSGGVTIESGNNTFKLASLNANTEVYPKFGPKTYTINLANMEADEAGTTSVSVTYNASTNMTSSDVIDKPTKAHYDFGGYYISEDGGITLTNIQLIDANGKWIKDVTDYTSHSGDDPTWVHDYAISLYAKWTEHEYAVTLAVSPAGTGTTSPASSTTAKYVTASGDIEAIPNAGYSFSEWDFSKTDAVNDIYCADGYSSISNPVHIHAQRDGTLTANFTAKTYTVRFENLGADAGHKGSSDTTVTFNDTINMKGGIEVPSKSHYDFGGYYISTDQGVTLTNIQIIDANGNWNKEVSGYTGTKDNVASWVCAGDTVLYAKWTEHEYSITMEVSPAGTGTTSPASTATGKLVTESGNITATPAAGYKFKEWQFSKTDENYDAWCADGYSSTDATIHIKAQHNGTLTAVFEERYSLVGSLQDNTGNGGMPGWEDYTKTFTVNSSSPVDLTRTCTLQANKTYKLQVHDLATSTNLGRSGCDPVCVLEENASLVMENSNNDVFLYTGGAGEYIFKITAVDGSGHPTLTVLRPYPVNFGQKYLDIDGTLHDGTTGGTASASASGALSSGDYVTYNTSVTHTATPETGYTFAGWWGSDAFEGDAFTDYNPWYNTVTSGDNAYAKFTEDSKSVTISKTGNGTITVGGSNFTWGNTTTCGVTTTRRLVATGDPGYRLSSWTVPDGVNFQLEDKASDTDNDVTLRGKASGSAGTVTANFVERYSIKGTMNGENWGTTHTLSNIGTNASSKDTCYVTMTLPANTTYEFAIYDEHTKGWLKNSTTKVFKMTYTNHTNWGFGTDKTVNCGITTAGKGTYKFIFNITDKTVTVVYPTSYQVNYGASVGGSVTSVKDDDNNDVPNGGYVRSGGRVTYTAAAASGYTFVGWCNNDSYGDTFNTELSWTNSNVTETQNSFAKFKSTNFVIYRTGDMSSDPRAAYDDVESYDGGTISEKIEYRMKVHELDKWYTLCLPFELDSVGVWDESAGVYYDLVPYYRTSVGGTLNGGHYIIRTPNFSSGSSIAIANFDDWRDPESPTWLPSENKPYIIQWHMSYFEGKYVSFFGPTGESIPTSMNQGANTSSDETVNIYGNNCMTSGTVRDAYMLDPDYGSGGAWLRAEVGTDRTVLPFECFIRANATTTAKYRVLRRDMADTPTGWDTVSETENKTTKVLIDNNIYIIRGDRMYTIQGTLVKEVE